MAAKPDRLLLTTSQAACLTALRDGGTASVSPPAAILCAVEPDLPIGAGSRCHVSGNPARKLQRNRVRLRPGRGSDCSTSYQRDDDEADKGRRHPERVSGRLDQLDENFADQRDENRNARQRAQCQAHGPCRLATVVFLPRK